MNSSSTLFAHAFRSILAAAGLLAALQLRAAPEPLDLSKIPVPPGSKPVAVFPHTAIYAADAPVEATADACAKLLADQGWVPYGSSGQTRYYKKVPHRLLVTVQSAPGQGGRTTISFGSDQMSADLPLPPEAEDVRYVDSDKRLGFLIAQSPETLAQFYRKALAPAGWTTNMAGPVKSDLDHVIIFRSPEKGMVRVEMRPMEQKLLASVFYNTAEEVAAEEKRAAAQGAALKAKLATEAAAPKPKVTIKLPADVVSKALIKNSLRCNVTAGKAKAVVEGIRKDLAGSGWKEESATLDAAAGLVTFSRESQTLSIDYMDPGFMPGEVGVKASGVEIELSK